MVPEDSDVTHLGEAGALSAAETGPRSGLHRRLTFNSLANLSRYIFSILLSFFLTPFVVKTLGNSLYGFWVILLSFVGYAGILELGMQPAVVKIVGQHRGHSDPDRMAELLGAAFVFFLAIGVLSALFFGLALAPLLPHLVKQAPPELGSRLLLSIIAVDVLLIFLNTFFTGVIYGWQLYTVKTAVDIVVMSLNAVVLFIYLGRGGLLLLAASKAITDLGGLLATLVLIRRQIPGFRLSLRGVNVSALRGLLGFGGRLFVSASTTRVATYAHPLVVSSRISSAATAFFAIPVRLVDYVRELGWALAAGFMPAFSELEARQERSALRSVYLRYSRYILIATLPIYVLLFVYGRDFISIWIGPEYGRRAALPLLFVTGAALVENLQPLYWRLFIGIGRLDLSVAVSAGASLASIVIGFLLVPVLDIGGPALAILITGTVSQILFLHHAAKYLKLSSGGLAATIAARPLAAGGLLLVLAWTLKHTWGGNTLLEIAAGAVVSLAVYVILVWWITVDGDERAWLRGRVRRAVIARS